MLIKWTIKEKSEIRNINTFADYVFFFPPHNLEIIILRNQHNRRMGGPQWVWTSRNRVKIHRN